MKRKSTSPSLFRLGTRLSALCGGSLLLAGIVWYACQPPLHQAEISRGLVNWMGGEKRITLADVLWDLWQIQVGDGFVPGLPAESQPAGQPLYGGAPLSREAVRILVNQGYVVGYSDERANPLWAAYRVQDVDTLRSPPRPSSFRVDSRTGARIEPGDYSRSGYDRGHLAPNFAIATRYGAQAQEETFLMSNISPQKHALNAGVWRELELKIATAYAGRFGEVWVLAGPVFSENPVRLRQRIAVPEAFFMIVLDQRGDRIRAQAFLCPQDAAAQAPLRQFATTIDEIERRTGLDFFSPLPDENETVLEGTPTVRVW